MKVTGYQLKEAIKLKSLELSTVISQFDESLHHFKGEEHISPITIAEKSQELEDEIVLLQVAQDYYNINIEVDSETTLAACIKAVGGYGRRAKLFREAATGSKRDRWERSRGLTRDADQEVAVPTISKQSALQEAIRYEKMATNYRTQIAVANVKVLDIPILNAVHPKRLFS